MPLFPKESQLGSDGEILVRGPGMFAGYWKNEEATRQAIQDGWFHTGDVAEKLANGHFRIIDRKKDIMVTSGGKNICAERDRKPAQRQLLHQRGGRCSPTGASFRAP